MPHEWEIWLDANLSPILAKWLADYTGLNVKSAFYLSLEKKEDLYIYRKAKTHGHVIIISKDSDFPEIISKWGSPPKLINIKVGNCSNRILWGKIQPLINQEIQLLISGEYNINDLLTNFLRKKL